MNMQFELGVSECALAKAMIIHRTADDGKR
jgi:hypothetical protein